MNLEKRPPKNWVVKTYQKVSLAKNKNGTQQN